MTTSPEDGAGAAAGTSPAASVSHQPGKRYSTGCRCDDCRAEQTQYMRVYRRRQAEKQWGAKHYTDRLSPEKAEKAIWRATTEYGMTQHQIAHVCGVTQDTVGDIRAQKRHYISRRVHDAIVNGLDFERGVNEDYTDGQVIDAGPYRHLIFCLLAQGWTQAQLKQILISAGRKHHGFMEHLSDMDRIFARTAREIIWLANTIGDRHGPSDANKRRMLRRGIFPLIHYDENGRLIRASLTPEQLQYVQSKHGDTTSRNHGDGPRARRR